MSTYAAKKNETLVDIMNLKKWYPVQKNIIDQILAGHTDYIRAVDGVTSRYTKERHSGWLEKVEAARQRSENWRSEWNCPRKGRRY